MSPYYNFRNKIYYALKPFIPRHIQIFARQKIARIKRRFYRNVWPIDPSAAIPPNGWTGWPDGKRFALVLSHDVDTLYGYRNVEKLLQIEGELGFRSIFNFVPERYGKISLDFLRSIKDRGFEVGLHGLKHDGKLFSTKKIFDERAPRLNHYLEKWGTNYFTSPSMHHNLSWLTELNISHAISTFDTDPFEPQPTGANTIFPFWVYNPQINKGYIEMPYTLPQDSTLFLILKEKTINIWKRKLEWIVHNGGMVLLNTHPDYMAFDGNIKSNFLYPFEFYTDFLNYIKTKYRGQYYHAKLSKVGDIFLHSELN